LAIAPPGHPVEIYRLPEGELIRTFDVPATPFGLACREDALAVLDSTGTLRVFGIPAEP
ncbi:MAG: hypothetical protein GXO36_06865, partial [Chloroflexi bacterium]|nr:hypothetical protein [Chloroflexota bacterium]NPA27300.1 hypothetical protein [Chloroflexota bacterium]